MKTTITIAAFSRDLGALHLSPMTDEFGERQYIRSDPSPPAMEVEITIQDGGVTHTHSFDMYLSCPQYGQLERAFFQASKELRQKQRDAEIQAQPIPNYRGNKITRVVSYDREVPQALVELEGQEGQWMLLFSSLDLCTQGFILDEWRKRMEDPSAR